MAEVVIEVSSVAARNWQQLSQKQRDDLSKAFAGLITIAFDKDRAEFFAFFDRIAKKAEANGLTPEILNQILNEED